MIEVTSFRALQPGQAHRTFPFDQTLQPLMESSGLFLDASQFRSLCKGWFVNIQGSSDTHKYA